MTFYDKDITEQAGKKILNYYDNSTCYKMLEERYPIGLNRINWLDVPNYMKTSLANSSDKPNDVSIFLKQILVLNPSISNDTIILWGDDAIERAYQIKYIDFEQICMLFFCLPQHTYGWLETTKKLINYTFEDELYFG